MRIGWLNGSWLLQPAMVFDFIQWRWGHRIGKMKNQFLPPLPDFGLTLEAWQWISEPSPA